ncbi:hypothetical protein [Azospirillum rugosum]|uniref:Uncharacterized protein n=1 Tax=Azospirillum rugosum TaxID=416170 RepID=A0ABS4SVP7_9PROT|nr:hypothetical protein [Azospirillum rugosum]MBP2296640.1 hypothetical protein [Azospirillum rugosum]MDQ0530301.1 hypothetical protein [Azospirillum rugosum]
MTVSAVRTVVLLLAVAPVAGPLSIPAAGAADPTRTWSAPTPAGPLTAALETRGKESALVLTLKPEAGVRVVPPVLRVDVPALLRARVAGRFPAAIRSEREDGPLRAVLPLKGPVRFADPDRNDGMMRVEFRYCRNGPATCAVQRLDIPLRAGP